MSASARGRIIAVQEDRFHLKTEDGRILRLALSNRAGLEIRDLRRLYAMDALVTVDYTGEADLASAAVHAVYTAG